MRPILLHPGDCLFLDGHWDSFGSLALPVRDRHGTLRLLTAAHVVGGLAKGHGTTTRICTSKVVRPASATQVYVGEVIESCPPTPTDRCLVDAALVAPAAGVTCRRSLSPEIDVAGIVCELDPVSMLDRRVFKVGCTTGLTTGVICKVGSAVRLHTKAGDVLYECICEVMSDHDRSCFAQPGDSGAVVVDTNGWVVGIVIGMQLPVDDPSSLAYVVPIELIIQELGVTLIGAR